MAMRPSQRRSERPKRATRNGIEGASRASVSLQSARALADAINAQQGGARAKVWAPDKPGMSPRVYVGAAGYLTLHGVDVHGLVATPGVRAARVTMQLGALYPAQRTALRKALERYSEEYALPTLESLEGEVERTFERARSAVLAAVEAGATTRRAVAGATGLDFFEVGRVLSVLAEDGEILWRNRGTESEKILA